MAEAPALLIVFGGLPGAGKTSVARALAGLLGATYVRIDTIEQAIIDSGRVEGSLDDVGYRVSYAMAEDNLRLGRTVIADSVNPIALTRDAWAAVARRAGARCVEVEVVCSDAEEHRRRVEDRTSDIPGLTPPTWAEVVDREYEPWPRPPIVIDTARTSVAQSAAKLRDVIVASA